MIKERSYGKAFKQIRKEKKVSLKDLEDIVARRTLFRYEKEETAFPISKLDALLKRLDFSLIDFYQIVHQDREIYPRYGKVFKKLREQRGFSPQDFSHIPVSRQQIMLFESSNIMLGFDKIYTMLLEMNVSLQDYSSLLNKGIEEPLETLLGKIDTAYYKGNRAALQGFYDESKNYKRFFLLSLTIKVLLGKASQEELMELEDFFMTVDMWSNYELFIFQHISKRLSSSNLKIICADILHSKCFFEDHFLCQRRLVFVGLEITLSRIKRKSPVAARYFLDFSKQFLQGKDELTGITYRFVENLYLYGMTGDAQYLRVAKTICDTAALHDSMMKEWYQKNYKSFIK